MPGKSKAIAAGRKRCTGPCGKTLALTVDNFYPSNSSSNGFRPRCKACACADTKERYDADPEPQIARVSARDEANRVKAEARDQKVIAAATKLAAKQQAAQAARSARLESEFEPLKADDFDDGVDIAGTRDPNSNHGATSDKRADYSRKMGAFRQNVERAAIKSARDGSPIADNLPAEDGAYIGALAEQGRRFSTRRVARSISLFAAMERDAIEQSIAAMAKYMSGRIMPTGYAAKPKSKRAIKRTVCCLLSDLHLGSDLSRFDEPTAFGPVEEARRLEYVLRQFLDYKHQYRDDSEALLILNGDMIEGQLMHDLRSGAPLTEQKMIFQSLLGDFVGHVAAQFPRVRVVCQPGNHGRDKVRHPGRATARKWDGHETEMYHGLKLQCRDLKNVEWQIDFRAVSIVDLYGSKLGVTHGDTDVKLGHPDNASSANGAALDALNSNMTHGVRFDAWVFGHFHSPRYVPRNPSVIYNGALVPPNGYARGAGYVGEPCGQFLWEAVPGYPIGDVRFIKVGIAQDRDESLGTLIRPFRFSVED